MKPLKLPLAPIVALLLLAAPAAPAAQAVVADRWERATPPRPLSRSDIEVLTSGQWIYVAAPRPVKVSLLTVLGQPVTVADLPAGVHRFRVATRGIYILRVSSSTFRITL